MTKEQVNIAIINGLKAKGHEVLKLNPDLLADFANITYKLLNIPVVVSTCCDNPRPQIGITSKHRFCGSCNKTLK